MRSLEHRARRRWLVTVATAALVGTSGCELYNMFFGEPDPQCADYCTKMAACNFDEQGACETSCQDTGAEFESCVTDQQCAPASRCILCQQYCDKLTQCGVSTDANCQSACDTNLASGGDSGKYQCVVDKVCSDIANCGI